MLRKLTGRTRRLIEEFEASGASDLHLAAGYPAVFRIEGRLTPVGGTLSNDAVLSFIEDLAGPDVIHRLLEREEADLSVRVELDGRELRFRVNLALFERKYFLVLRRLREIEASPADLGVPHAFTRAVSKLGSGVVFVTGTTGSGKSTTLASVIAALLKERPLRVVTLEDPIEYVIPPGKGMVTQREILWDTKTFAAGLRAAMRQDPDVILVGEVRDRETAEALLAAAETGHLVFATLHVAATTLIPERIMGFFPDQASRDAALARLSSVFAGAMTQALVPTHYGKRALAWEYLPGDTLTRRKFARGEFESLRLRLRDARTRLADSLIRFVAAGLLDEEEAFSRLNVPDEWDQGYLRELKDFVIHARTAEDRLSVLVEGEAAPVARIALQEEGGA